MTRKECDAIYLGVCKSYDRLPNDQQGNAWFNVLGQLEVAPVLAGVEAWQADTTEDYQGRARGSFMPQPADIRSLIERRAKVRTVNGRACCGNCEGGWVRVFEGTTGYRTPEGRMVSTGHPVDPKLGAMRRCPECAELRRMEAGA